MLRPKCEKSSEKKNQNELLTIIYAARKSMHELTIFRMVQFSERFGSMSANTRKPLANNLFDINTNTNMFDVQQLFKHIPIKYLICAY